jgi:zinc protease
MKRLLLLTLALAVASNFAFAQAPAAKTPAQKSAEKTTPAPTASTAPSKGVPGSWKKVPIPKLPPFNPPQPTRIELSNGMIIFLQVDHELPLIAGFARIRGGSRSEPAEKVGMVEMYGQVWRTGGTTSLTGDQLDDFLEARAAKVEAGGGVDSTTVGFDCLKADFPDVLKVVVDLLHNPAFREDKLALAKNQMKTSISRRNDDTGSIASRESGYLAYGKENPYAREEEYYTVDAVTREDLVAFHKQYVHPNNILLGVTGDFDPKQMEAALREAFEKWPKGPAATEPTIALNPAKPGLYVVDKEDVNQSEIMMVTPGIRRDNPDYFAVQVLNELFGGSFGSRLTADLRTKRGLAYSVGGGVGSAFDHPGVTRIAMGTKSETTAEGIRGLWEEVEGLKKNPPTEEELKRAKDNLLNSFIFHFDSPGKVMRERMAYEFYGYPADFLDRYRAAVERVTLDDVNRVAAKYLHNDQFAVLVVGNLADTEKSLMQIGPLRKVDITIPNEKPSPQAKPAEKAAAVSNPEGKALVEKVLQAAGGAEKIGAIKTMHQTLTQMQKTPQGDIPIDVERTLVLPNKAAVKLGTPMGERTMVVTPEVAFIAAGGQQQDLPGSFKNELLGSMQRETFVVLQHIGDPKYTFAANGTENVDGKDAAILDISVDGKPVRWYVDPATGHLLRVDDTSVGQRGPTKQSMFFSEWKTVDGITYATKSITKQNGEQVASAEVKEMKINPQVDPKIFEKPAAAATAQ